jgi:hypothetical protein
MDFENVTYCKNCKSENPYFNLKCSICNSFLRDKIPNIDLGNIIINLIETPKVAFNKIILAEYKNYVLLLMFLISIRFMIISRFISVPFGYGNIDYNLKLVLIYFLIISLITFLSISFCAKTIIKIQKLNSRFGDIFSVITYSFIPYVIALIILYPSELAVYGNYLFSNNPYPFEVKETTFYVFLFFEFLLISWSIILHYNGFRALRLNNISSLLLTFLSTTFVFGILFLSTKVFVYL